ncbi:hypothetical protein STEG23_035825 [Scotinomys teguina]
MGGRGSGQSEAVGSRGRSQPAMRKTRCSSYRVDFLEYTTAMSAPNCEVCEAPCHLQIQKLLLAALQIMI